uniref:Uncharacterized protein n=1 Tax=Oryza rufipogon TaxID=4529 RepID=A0A0E0NRK4_ORYRU
MRRSSNAQLADAEDMKGASQLKDTNFLNDEKGYKLSAYGFGHIKEDHTKVRNLIRSIFCTIHCLNWLGEYPDASRSAKNKTLW